MTSHVAALVEARLNCLQYLSSPTNSTWDQLTDTWFAPSDNNIVYSGTVPNDSNKDYIAALRTATNATRRLLFNGEQVSADACWNAVRNNGWLAGPHNAQMDRREDYLGQTFTSDWDFGKWAADSRDLLMQLDVMATGTGGVAQDQWACCGNCGVLHYNNAASQCPAPGTGGTGHHGLAKPELRRSRRFALSARRYAGGMALVQELRRAALWRRGWERLPKRKRPACQRWQRQLSARRDIRHPIQGIACRRWLENGATNAASCIPARRRVSARPTAGHTRPMAAADYRLGKIGNALWPFVHDSKHDDFPG